jgi:tRNA(Ile)-lysidine synthase TilS/MesJ
MFEFRDRLGNRETWKPQPGDRVETLLLRHNVPPASVLVQKGDQPVSDAHVIEPDATYVAALIEGYDIGAIRAALGALGGGDAADSAYAFRRLTFAENGALDVESVGMDGEEVADMVEAKILDTCREYNLIREGDAVVLGLSGGVDSSSLLLAFDALRPYLPKFRLATATFEDEDQKHSETLQHAIDLAKKLGFEHEIVPLKTAQEIFHLKVPLREVMPALMQTPDAHNVMYIEHHATRRALEVYAERNGLNRIAWGLHTTDLLAGLLNSFATGYHIGNLPVRPIGKVDYIYPLTFVPKRELHLYHFQRTGRLARHAFPNEWEIHPKDRNFYYYLADRLQAIWPGLETMLVPAHNWRIKRQPALTYETCENCGSTVLHQPWSSVKSDECDACTVFRKHGYIEE